jgi:hypothetical protein
VVFLEIRSFIASCLQDHAMPLRDFETKLRFAILDLQRLVDSMKQDFNRRSSENRPVSSASFELGERDSSFDFKSPAHSDKFSCPLMCLRL